MDGLPATRTREGFVYLFRMGEFHKIGSSGNVRRRLAEFASLPYECDLVHQFPSANALQVEKALHRRFRSCRVKGEWFRLSDEDVNRLQQLERIDAADDLPADLLVPRKSSPDGKGSRHKPRRMMPLTPWLYDKLRASARRDNRPATWQLKHILTRYLFAEGFITEEEMREIDGADPGTD